MLINIEFIIKGVTDYGKYKEYKLLLSNYADNDNTILKPYETRILYREGWIYEYMWNV